MNFLRLKDELLSVLYEDNDIIAIDKPYGFNAHTNDSKAAHSEFIQDGLIEMFEKQIEKKLHIVHRLDQTTTGVMIFGKSVDSAKKYADYFLARQVKKTYWFVTQKKSEKTSFLIDLPIVHKAKELEAKTQFNLIKKLNQFELWQALPFTGRNHQIRIHAQAAKISILGDTKYEGNEFSFLCLHNHRIEFPNGIVIISQPPIYFTDLSLLQDLTLTKALFAVDRRHRLYAKGLQSEQSFRLVHNQNNSKDPGFTIDQYGSLHVLTWFKESWTQADSQSFTKFSNLMDKALLARTSSGKRLFFNAAKSQNNLEPPRFWQAKENKIQYELQAEMGASVGLFLNQRLQRNWVLNNSKNKSVLNLYAHTGAFSVAARVGEAEAITSVELNKNALNMCKKNFAINNLDLNPHMFLCRDSFTYLEQCHNKKLKYDLILCDTPSFYRQEKGVFKIENNIEKTIQCCLQCLKPKGVLLFSTNFDGFFIDDIRKIIQKVQKTLKIDNLQINCVLASLDFELPEEKTNLKSFLIQLEIL